MTLQVQLLVAAVVHAAAPGSTCTHIFPGKIVGAGFLPGGGDAHTVGDCCGRCSQTQVRRGGIGFVSPSPRVFVCLSPRIPVVSAPFHPHPYPPTHTHTHTHTHTACRSSP